MDVSKKVKNVSAADHVKHNPAGVLHSDGGKLFCTSCNVTIDHSRELAVGRHLDSSIHRKRKVEIQSSTVPALIAKKQKTVTSMSQKSTENREAQNALHFDLTEAFVCTNIPLEKLDNQKLHKFFRLSGGGIPSSAQLRHEYLPKVAEYHKQ
ncbi:CGG triplet repeat-binding protein 1 [Acipenser ruthenus]|uniref:CGG triplet repeat-binding protein 1 n=1 Tax=Acipenser ruthenus TaxID=7906 RepID=A0A444TYQ2_ACIRT|nr:CGG triplet repeat-binding protein 1 [Acipenser ruthenus]